MEKLVNDQCDDWDRYIPGVLFAYHSSIHASTKCTPFEVMYGRTAKLPVDVKSAGDNYEATSPIPGAANPDILYTLHTLRRDICTTVSSNITKAQARQKEQYDRDHITRT